MNDNYEKVLSEINSSLSLYQKKDNKEKKLIIVSKSQTINDIKKVINKNYLEFGENYVEEGIKKIAELNNKRLKWHFIGKIQSNKIKKIVKFFDWIQTLSSLKHAELIHNECSKHNKKINICIQININNEDSKGGIKINEIEYLKKKHSA